MREAMKTQEDSRQTFWTMMFLGILLIGGVLVALGCLELTALNQQGQTGSVSMPATK